jgi:GxxExxY protein
MAKIIKVYEKKLSFILQGIFINVSKDYGCNFKEEFYLKALEKELMRSGLSYKIRPKIKIYSNHGETIDYAMPDFIIENKIIIEVKAVKSLMESAINQLMKYLQKSHYQIGYLVNFGTSYAQVVRRIYTNDRKPFI